MQNCVTLPVLKSQSTSVVASPIYQTLQKVLVCVILTVTCVILTIIVELVDIIGLMKLMHKLSVIKKYQMHESIINRCHFKRRCSTHKNFDHITKNTWQEYYCCGYDLNTIGKNTINMSVIMSGMYESYLNMIRNKFSNHSK